MKKLILSAAILLGSLSTFAAATVAPTENLTEKSITAAAEFTEIKIAELPSAITESLKKSHPDAVISKAYVNESKQYKLDLTTGDKSETILTDAEGTLVKE